MLLLVVLINFTVDPTWCFTHANRLNARQLAFDERQQKANFLIAHPAGYDAVMLGSSRTTFINQYAIADHRVFNFAVNAMVPAEYAAYVRFFNRHNRDKTKLIFLGLDFFGSNKNFNGYSSKTPEEYFANAENRWYRYTSLLTADLLLHSCKNIRQLFAPTKNFYYDRTNVKRVDTISDKTRQTNAAKDLEQFKRELYGKNYVYQDIKPDLMKLKEQNPSSRFIVFVTPESMPVWNSHIQAGRMNDYLRWLEDIVTVFGEVHTFMGENTLTTDARNFQDAHHLMPQAAQKMMASIMEHHQASVSTPITKNRFAAYAEQIRSAYPTTQPAKGF